MLGKWGSVVYLKRVLDGILATIVVLTLKSVEEFLPTIGRTQVGIVGVRVACIGLATYLIRQREQTVFDRERALIVDAAIDICVAALGMTQGVVAIQMIAVERRCGQD